MSDVLLQRVSGHVSALITGYSVRYYRWTDADLNGQGGVVLFRMSGTGGAADYHVQYPDVSIQIICDPDKVRDADATMLAIVRYLRSEAGFTSATVENFEPLSQTGPAYLQNGRARFELVVRCMVEDH